MKGRVIKSGSTIFLRLVIFLIGAVVLALCTFVLPAGITSDKTGMYRPILMGMYVPAVPFFIALYQGLKLLHYIDKNRAFSLGSVKALKIIKYCGITISVLYMLGMPYIFTVADRDDAPGVFLLGLVFTFAPMAVAVCAAVLQNLLSNAMAIKSEHDLTV